MTERHSLSELFDRALAQHRAGYLTQASALYRQILAHSPDQPDVLHFLGILELASGRPEVAIALLKKAVQINPAADICQSLGAALTQVQNYAAACVAYAMVLQQQPDSIDALNACAMALQKTGQPEDALRHYQKVLLLQPDNKEALNNAGNLLARQGRFAESPDYYRRLLAIDPGNVGCISNLAHALTLLGDNDEAVALGRTITALEPENAGHHFALAVALLALGQFDEGFREYQWRWKTENLKDAVRDFPQPRWQGEDITGQTLLVHGEQGFGDTLQFCRYATLAAARGIRVVVDAPMPLVRLLKSLSGIDQVVAAGDPLPPFDYHCPVIDMAPAFHTRPDTIPSHTPYLFADAADLAIWQQRLPPMPGIKKIGLVWAGNPRRHSFEVNAIDRRRSIPLGMLAPFFALPGFVFYSLQKDHAPPSSEWPIIDRMAECHDFADTAALIMQLDLVICVDTSVVHLAGALGKPVWMLDRFDSCWRWPRDRAESSWYPTLRIFRQTRPGDWTGVIQRVEQALRLFGNTP